MAGTAAVAALGLPVETIGSRVGGIPQGVPQIHVPAFRADLILPLFPAALTVALLAAVESLLSAVVADSMTGDRHNSNVELMAQGVDADGPEARQLRDRWLALQDRLCGHDSALRRKLLLAQREQPLLLAGSPLSAEVRHLLLKGELTLDPHVT